MDVALTRISMWLRGGKRQESGGAAQGPSMSSSFDFGLGLREPETVKLSSSAAAAKRRIKRKWQSREERKVDKEYDLVIVPSDGGCLSGSESDDSDWSVGWMEPLAPDFPKSDDSDGDGASFAVIVQCYARRYGERSETTNRIDETTKYMEEFLSSLQNG